MQKIYKQGDETTFEPDTEEYKRLEEIAKKMTELSPNKQTYKVEDVYLDYGQDWMWTTIVNVERGYQILSPRDWMECLNNDDTNAVANEIIQKELK